MADVFKILLEAGKKTRITRDADEKIESLMDNEEKRFYNEEANESNSSSMDLDDFKVGEERDADNYISDIEKISLRDLDKKPAKEQLKTLKLEYNRLYDKVVYLNNELVDANRNYSDLMLDKRTDEAVIKELKSLFRQSINHLPGNPDLKVIVSKGNWKKDDIAPLLEKAIDDLVDRYNNVDREVELATEAILSENIDLKDKILKYKKIASKVEELQKLILSRNTSAQTSSETSVSEEAVDEEVIDTSAIEEIDDNPFGTEDEEVTIPFSEDEETEEMEPPEPKEEKKNQVSKHEAHFNEFFSGDAFEKSYKDLKKQNKNSPSKAASSPKQSDLKQKKKSDEVDNHPLSPDFVETEKQKVSDLFDSNLQEYLNNIGENQEFILKIIGETGISRNPDLRDYLKEHPEGKKIYMKGNRFEYQHLSADVSELRGKNILDEEKLNLGGKGGGATTIIYQLSHIGKQCYKYLFKDDPVVPEKKRILDHHASLEHGYMIKDSAKIFMELGYKVYTNLEDVTIYTEENSTERKVFDFIIEDKSGKKMHIEVERGTHNKEDFFKAMDKIHKITNEFYFICPNDTIKNQTTKQMFFSWITERLGGIKNANVILNMTTIIQLRKKPKNLWETTDLTQVK